MYNLGFILIVTGKSDDLERDDGQIVHINDASKRCQLVQPYPIPLYTGTGNIVSGVPIVCGGQPTDESYTSQCFMLDTNTSTWIFLSDMSTPRQDVASLQILGLQPQI